MCEFFCCLPFAAVINNKIFCVHAGIGEYIITPEEINHIERPIDVGKYGLPYDLIYTNPCFIRKDIFNNNNNKIDKNTDYT